MKILTLIFTCLTFLSYGQTDLNTILKGVQELKIPYSSENTNDKGKILVGKDSTDLITQLIAKRPITVNNVANSPFGQFDCNEKKDCLNMDELKAIEILGYVKVDSNNYLIYTTIMPKGQFASSIGILMSVNNRGEWIDWFIADNSTWGNHNGQLSRDFKIDKNYKITVSESSWGRNNINYSLKVKYKVFRFAENKESRNDLDEHNDYENNKIEYFDLKEGKFELTKLCLDI